MTYVAIHLKDYVDNRFDIFVLDRGGMSLGPNFVLIFAKDLVTISPLKLLPRLIIWNS